VVSDQPVVVERPLYAVHDFGGGTVRGATDALGATSLGTVFGFANASTMSGDWDFLTFQNPGSVAASVKVSYYDTTAVIQQSLTVPAGSRQTLQLFTAGQGPGIGDPLVGTVITSDQPILVEKPDYSTNGTGGAADAMGYQPASGSFQP
jgi:hypothetical protein